MGEIEIELNDQDLALLMREGALRIPLGEAIIDGEPIIALEYAEDKPGDYYADGEE